MNLHCMGTPMFDIFCRPHAPKSLAALILAGLMCAPHWALAQNPAPRSNPAPDAAPDASSNAAPTPAAPVANSNLDDRLFYQLLVAEMALNSGDAGSAFELILEAARRTRDEGLFRRSVDIALQARAGEQALTATKAWRQAAPKSTDAMRLQMQVLLLLNRPAAITEPLKELLAQVPAAERPGLITALPRLLDRAQDPKGGANAINDALDAYRDAPTDGATRLAARLAQGRVWLQAREPDRALALAREAQSLEPSSSSASLLALELLRERPAAENIITDYLRQDKADEDVRQLYVRLLTSTQRYADAITQLEVATQRQPKFAPSYLSLGALHLELKHNKEGEAALLRYIDLVQAQNATNATNAGTAASATGAPAAANTEAAQALAQASGIDDDDEEDNNLSRPERGLTQAWLMLAQAAEQRRDFAGAERWLTKIGDPQRALEVQTRRATIMARQGKLVQARELIRKVPERRSQDARAKLVAEASVLREVKQWREAYGVLADANKRFADDSDLLYEQAMVAEKIDRLADMEKLLRKVIAIKPDSAQAHNALGYSLADRQQRLPEARKLIQRALELSPGDPFITDSLGWVEFRLGNRDEALRLLRGAYGARPDVEIAAHLGEVLWTSGQKDEARRVWREGKTRDASNDVLRETLTRLRVEP
jgi:tetratricopeptide (TPR) repeat protein